LKLLNFSKWMRIALIKGGEEVGSRPRALRS